MFSALQADIQTEIHATYMKSRFCYQSYEQRFYPISLNETCHKKMAQVLKAV